jgi:iron complex outermembrane recepter protein
MATPNLTKPMEKPMTRNVLKTLGLIRVALVVGLGLPLAVTSVHAQNAAPAPATQPAAAPAPAPAGGTQATAEAERVIVTGSNIPTAEEVGPNPVLNLNRDLINKSGERQAAELLRNLPVANANGVPISNNATGFTPGAASISLRGFTPEATLLLVDGRRVAPYPVGQGGTTSFNDLFTIPLPAVQSIEILKDGASAIYGADAIAGVVNLKFYKEYHGAQATIQYGNTLDKDAAIYSGDILFGVGDDTVSIAGDINFYHHNSMFNKDRGNSNVPAFLSSNSSPENLQISKAVAVASGGTAVGGSSPVEFAHAPFNTNGFAPASAYTYSGGRASHFDYNLFSGSYPEQERWGGYAAFNDKICEEQVQLYGDFYYEDVKTHNELAPSATGSFLTPGQVTLAIPPGHDLNGVAPPNTPRFAGQGTGANPGENATNVPINAFNPFNPFDQIISGGSRARLIEFGNRLFDNESDAWLTTLGVKGDKLFDGNWGYDAGFRYSQIKNTSNGTLVSTSRFNRILNANDTIFQPGSPDFIGTTIPFNPFGSYRGSPIPSNDATVNFATVHPKDIDTSKLTELDLNIYTIDLFDLPAGGVGLAVGAQFRRENITQSPDQLNLDGDIIGSSKEAITHAGRKDYAIYAETNVPIFSPSMGIPGFHSLELTGSGRFEEFLNNSTNVLVPKVGLRWQPFDEQLTIRSTWGEGFREPSLFELYASPTFALTGTRSKTTTQFPVAVTEPETATTFASNPNLQPEDSRAWTGGFVYTPKWIPPQYGSLTLSLDLWDIERTGTVVTPSSQEVVNRFYRNALLPGEIVQVDPSNGAINFVRTAFQNSGRQEGRGADLSGQWQLQTAWGTWTVLSQWAYLDEFIFQNTIESHGKNIVAQDIGTSDLGGDGFFRWRGVTRVDWAWHNFDLNATWHYVSGFREAIKYPGSAFNGLLHEHYANPTNFIDVQAGYTLIFTPPVESQPVAGYSKGGKEVMTGKDGKAIESTAAYTMPCWQTILNNSTITVGCNNVFGQDPPDLYGYFFGNANNYPAFEYDNIGRFWYIELKKKF